jgi:hypothetical protein
MYLDQMEVIMCGENMGRHFRKNNFLPPFKYDGGSVKVCECMAASGVGNPHFIEGIYNKNVCVNVFCEHLKAVLKNLGFKNILYFTRTMTQTISPRLLKSDACTTSQK